MQKCQISIFISDPLQAAHLGGPSALGRPQIKKCTETKSSQNLILMGVNFMLKVQNTKLA